jgi:hypothetical protein
MILCGVIEPESLEKKYFDSDLYGEGVKYFLHDIITKGILIVDNEKVLNKRLLGSISKVPIKYQKHIAVLLEEIVKVKNKTVVCKKTEWKNSSLHTIGNITKFNRVDGVFCRPNQVDRLRNEYSSARDCTHAFNDYFSSPYVSKIRNLESRNKSIKNLSENELEELLRPVLQHTSTLRLFDIHIGKGSSLANFERGISFILRAWSRSVNIPAVDRKVEIYTLSPEWINMSLPEAQRKGQQDNVMAAIENVEDKLIDPLLVKHKVPIEFIVKQTESAEDRRDAHARYLETDHFVIHFERGFDIMKSDGSFCDTPVRLDNSAFSTTKWWKNLPEYHVSEYM